MNAFDRVLVPFDGSALSLAALGYGIALAKRGSALTVATVVDESDAVSGAPFAHAFDPGAVLSALEQRAVEIVAEAHARCDAAGVVVRTLTPRGAPVPALVALAAEADLVVMGTHARRGLTRAVVGSTTEGVLRATDAPLLAITSAEQVPGDRMFGALLLAVDDSEPSDAAASVATRIARAFGAELTVCCVCDTRDAYQAVQFGCDPGRLVDDMRAHAVDVADRVAASAGIGAYEIRIPEGKPVSEIVRAAAACGASAIVVGSHGRRGLRRLMLGSVAEHLVRESTVPVLVVRRLAQKVAAAEAAPAVIPASQIPVAAG